MNYLLYLPLRGLQLDDKIGTRPSRGGPRIVALAEIGLVCLNQTGFKQQAAGVATSGNLAQVRAD